MTPNALSISPLARRMLGRLVSVSLCLTWAVSLGAQTGASLTGAIRDASGRPVADARVTLTSESRPRPRLISPNDAGVFVVLDLDPGPYRLVVTKDGFQPCVDDLVAETGRALRVNCVLSPGSVEEHVDVTGASRALSADAQLGLLIDRVALDRLPLSGGTMQRLMTLTPGVQFTSTQGAPGEFSVNGQRATANNTLVDGVGANVSADPLGRGMSQTGAGTMTALSAIGTTTSLISTDAVEEVRVLTSAFAPEHGRNPGAQILVTSRGGTSALHATARYRGRHDSLDATDWFTNNRGLTQPELKFHDGSVTIGGPASRRETFFFGSYERQSMVLPQTLVSAVPSLASRAAASSAVRPLLDTFPLPNGPDVGLGLSEYTAAFDNRFDLDSVGVRVDQALNAAGRVFGRVAWSRSSSFNRSAGGGSALSHALEDQTRFVAVTTGYSAALGSRWLLDGRANYTRNRLVRDGVHDTFGGASEFPPSLLNPAGPSIAAAGVFLNVSSPGNYQEVGRYGGTDQQQINLVGSASMQLADHLIKAGVDFRRLFPEALPQQYRFVYNLNGVEPTATIPRVAITGYVPSEPVFDAFSAYLQDTWLLSSAVTVTAGLRIERNEPPSADGLQPLLVAFGDTPGAITVRPSGSPLWRTETAIAPRVGISYVMRQGNQGYLGSTVLKGGFGLFYDVGIGRSGLAFGRGYPFERRIDLTNVTLPINQSVIDSLAVTDQPGASQVYGFPDRLRLPKTYQWQVGVEQGLGTSTMIGAAYVGAAGRDLLRAERIDLTGIRTDIRNIESLTNGSFSDYDSLQLSVRRRLHRGIAVTGAYTLSRSTDNASDEFVLLAPEARYEPALDEGPSDFDIRHSVSISSSLAAGTLPGRWRFLSGLTFDVLFMARSALPINPVINRNLGFGSFNFRPDAVPDRPLYLYDSIYPGGRRINPAAFATPQELRQGNARRNSVRGFAFTQLDAALGREWHIGSTKIGGRLEVFNVLNAPQFGTITPTVGTALFGQAARSLANTLGGGSATTGTAAAFQPGGPRSVQFSATFGF